jgi:amino acid adenylation domain-containing protein
MVGSGSVCDDASRVDGEMGEAPPHDGRRETTIVGRALWAVKLAATRCYTLLAMSTRDALERADAQCVHRRFTWWASRTPDAPAILAGDRSLSYAEVRARAGRVARCLRARGVGPETPVAIATPRTPDAVAAILGVLEAGGAYVPLDVAHPAARLRAILHDCRPLVLLAHAQPDPHILPPGTCVLPLDGSEPADEAGDAPEAALDPDNIAYVIYTSGSTGLPNGVLTTHRGLAGVIASATTLYSIVPGQRVLQAASLGFDASVLEIFLALANGATLAMCADLERISAPGLERFLRRHRVAYATLTPLMLATLDPASVPDLATIAVGGDTCLPELPRRWAPDRALFNAYGPTEASIFVSAYRCRGDEESPPIGTALPNMQMMVLDGEMQRAGIGVAGEIHIGGPGLARGYLRQPALTAERFVPNPFSGTPGSRLYRTGDLGRMRADGNVEFLGRADRQVKVRGVRLEPGEVEHALRRYPALANAIVRPRERAGAVELVAYYVPPSGAAQPTVSEMRAFLKVYLPEPMLPAHLVALERFPMTVNGKLDERALPVPDGTPAAGTVARSDLERQIAAVWEEVLGVTRPIGVDESFFDLGGHSLVASRLVAALRERLAVPVPLRLIFESPTVADMAAALAGTVAPDCRSEAVETLRSPRPASSSGG